VLFAPEHGTRPRAGDDPRDGAAEKDGHVSEFLIVEVVLRASRIHGAHLSAERVHDTRRPWVQDADVVGIGHLGSWVIAV
jgi:hypothetical protein